ncbi:MAG: RING finger protein, partial [Promethearchaeota archaeon]
ESSSNNLSDSNSSSDSNVSSDSETKIVQEPITSAYYYCNFCEDHVRQCTHGSFNKPFPNMFVGKHGDIFCGPCGTSFTGPECKKCSLLVNELDLEPPKKKMRTSSSFAKCDKCDGTGQFERIIIESSDEEEDICPSGLPVDHVSTCIICLDKPVDTTVSPCMHSVVCRVCSTKLKDTGDNQTCVRCRCPITNIYHKDNTVEST